MNECSGVWMDGIVEVFGSDMVESICVDWPHIATVVPIAICYKSEHCFTIIFIFTLTLINEWVHLNLGTYCSAIGTLFLSILPACGNIFAIRWVSIHFFQLFFAFALQARNWVCYFFVLYFLAINVENVFYFWTKLHPREMAFVCVCRATATVYTLDRIFYVSNWTTRNAYYIYKWNEFAVCN